MNLNEYLNTIAYINMQRPPIRLKNHDRSLIPEIIKHLELKVGAEIGVAGGKFSEQICKVNPDVKLFCIDTWGVGDDWMSKSKGQQVADDRYEEAAQRLKKYDATLMREKSMEAVLKFEKESLDFVYIDACHEFDWVMQDIIEWSKRVKKGGIIAGHDYYRFRNAGVIDAVDVYIRCHEIKHAYLTKEIEASWFWQKS